MRPNKTTGKMDVFVKTIAKSSAKMSTRIEWPTLLVFGLAYSAWLSLTAFHTVIPTVLLVPGLFFIVALHSSLQHEVIHGHPTGLDQFNKALAFPAPGLLVPFERFELLHLQHHRNWLITDPFDDSESYFLARRRWLQCRKPIRALLTFNNTLAGRLIIGPAVMLIRMASSEFKAMQNNTDVLVSWLWHLIGILIVLVWLWAVNFSVLFYFIAVAYPAASLLMLRSYSEHLPEENLEHRSAIIKSNPVMQLLYLNNNYHRVHHDHPEVAWYELPQLYKSDYAHHDIHVYSGYWELLKRFAFKQRFPVEHPFLAKN